MRELPGVQGSDRWNRNRWGRITASHMGEVMAVLKKGGESAERRNYRLKLMGERLTGSLANNFVSREMQEGIEREDEARSLYEQATETLVAPVGFVLHPEWIWAGASPDGLIGDSGLLEIKSPQAHTLLYWLEMREQNEKEGKPDTDFIPREYYWQMQWQMRCCDPAPGENHFRREWCDFWGWYPGLPPIIQRVPRDEATIASLEYMSMELHNQIEAAIARMNRPATEWHDDIGSPELPEDAPSAYDHTKDFADQDWSCLGEDLERA